MAGKARLANGNGHIVGAKQQEPEENIFMFIPNLIGRSHLRHETTNLSAYIDRLCTHRPGHRIPLLHASASANMRRPLHRIVPARRPRRTGCPTLQSIHKVWRSAGHGDGQMHDVMLAGVPGVRVSKMVHRFPRADQSGSGEPLHAHVRDVDHGRIWAEP